MLTGGIRWELNMADELTEVTVLVYREGAKETTTPVTVQYRKDAPQAKWSAFLIAVREALHLQGIDGIYTDIEGYYTAQVATLVPGARYYVRPTEDSALTRSLTVDKYGQYPAWDIVDRGREVLHNIPKK